MQASEILATLFLPIFQTVFTVQIKVSTISASTLLLALPSGIIIHIVQFSRCGFQPLLRSDFSIQLLLGTEIRSQRWWAKVDSNHRPHDYQSCALAS